MFFKLESCAKSCYFKIFAKAEKEVIFLVCAHSSSLLVYDESFQLKFIIRKYIVSIIGLYDICII